MTHRVRFAPSPTGYLHAGNLRTAIVNHLFVQATGGVFVLRIDDTDVARSKEAYVDGIRRDLAWLGIRIDEEHRQSARLARYDGVLAELKAAGRVYACYETQEELDLKRKIQLSRSLPPVYDRAALKLTADEIAKFEAEGRSPHWRFKLETASKTEFDDLVQGHVKVDAASLSDPVIRRADGSWLYMLPSVIDDVDMHISHVVRGQDHLTNSGMQIQMFEAMQAPVPLFAHLALLSTRNAELSKRLGSAGVEHYKAIGVEPLSLMAYLGRLGTSDNVEVVQTIAPLVASFNWSHFNKANALFDEEELKLINTKILHHLPYEAVQAHLPATVTAAHWAALGPNVVTLLDMPQLMQLVSGPIAPVIEDAAFVEAARASLAALEWGADIWKRWTDALKASTGRKGKELFMPLRLALTAQAHGPDMGALLPLIGRDAALNRLVTPAG
jgi:glutamyl-tRNA synthetase